MKAGSAPKATFAAKARASLLRLAARRAASETPSVPVTGFGRRRRAERPRHRPRHIMAIGLFCTVYAVIGGRLLLWGAETEMAPETFVVTQAQIPRPDLLDRNGEILATDIRSASLFAEPRRIADADEAAERLLTVLPDLDRSTLLARLSSEAGFAWLRREISPRQQRAIHALGITGIGFRTEKHRFYPGGNATAQVLGRVDADNQGIAGIEKYLDEAGAVAVRTAVFSALAEPAPVKLSLDLRVQHILSDELAAAMERYKASASGGIILDARTGEVIAMASLPHEEANDTVRAAEAGTGSRVPDRAALPRDWNDIDAIASARGPSALRAVAAAAALVNGGDYLTPTFLPRTLNEADALKVPVIDASASDEMRRIMSLGGAWDAAVPGYDVGGRAQVADRDGNSVSSYLGAFPMSQPRYVVLVTLDEPRSAAGRAARAAGRHAASTTGAIIQRAAAFLGVRPSFGDEGRSLLVSY
ncbi:penicillin-binding transpeptidase domain-containing protein [Aureimonas mangrovi]|uniref:penicillin-binding transpeptidase domain-containing protein n=1 Tax=Aureimonas mangrovi TaxID=2758041 RepID=UPI00163DC6E3|nr:penicillin-binding transpeptidase domain-containing protein [Aureimonas mangrovi]